MFVFSLNRSLKLLSTCALAALLTACATPKQWGPELQLRQLCKQAGVFPLQPFDLSAKPEEFAYGKSRVKPEHKFYQELKWEDVRRDCPELNCISIRKATISTYRVSDDALVFQVVDFVRKGGDAFFSSTTTCSELKGFSDSLFTWMKTQRESNERN